MAMAGAECVGLLFVALSEWLFWAEFGNRFDFIAVDYLVYTHEVIGNIKESYPVGMLLTGLAVPAVLIATFLAACCSNLPVIIYVLANGRCLPASGPRELL